MSKRFKVGKRSSARQFSGSAQRVHPKNMLNSAMPMRGGYRL